MVMGFVIGKVVLYVIRCKFCRVCDLSKRLGKVVKSYDCRKNYLGFFKLMERDVVCEFWRSVFEVGVKFFIYVGDDDSIILVDIYVKVLYDV